MPILNVIRGTDLVGQLVDEGSRGMSFQYDVDYLALDRARPISLSLPLREDAYDGDLPRAWFANLLPEGEIRGHVARRLGISERNEFGMLAGIGGECAGALRIVPESDPATDPGGLVPLPWDKLEAAIAQVPRPSLLALMMQDGELRLSLAGAQDKLPVHFDPDTDRELALPHGQAASTHILKVANTSFPDLVQNELYCLSLAREAGLPVPEAMMAPTVTPILLVRRYDRCPDSTGGIRRLHQEDFCQALGVPPEQKYENEGGPSLARMFEVLARGSRSPLPDKRDLLRWVLFNFIVGNADAHAKNVSFLMETADDEAAPRLAPFYDLVCTAVYGTLSPKQAQKVGGEYRPGRIAARHWERFAAAIDVKPQYLRRVGLELCQGVEERAASLAGEIAGDHAGGETLERIVGVVGERVGWLRMELAF